MTQLHDTPQPQDVAARVRAALASPDPDALGPLLDDNVRWGGEEDTPETCHTRSDVLNRLAAQRAAGVQTQVVEVLASDESIVLGLMVKRPIDGGFARERTVHQVLTLRNGLIADIRGYPTRAEAAARAGLGPATTRGIEAREVIPILNVSSLLDSFDWFAKLGWAKKWDWRDPGGTPSFGAVASGGREIFLCLNAQGGVGERVELAVAVSVFGSPCGLTTSISSRASVCVKESR